MMQLSNVKKWIVIEMDEFFESSWIENIFNFIRINILYYCLIYRIQDIFTFLGLICIEKER